MAGTHDIYEAMSDLDDDRLQELAELAAELLREQRAER
jgi:hypothetical protein